MFAMVNGSYVTSDIMLKNDSVELSAKYLMIYPAINIWHFVNKLALRLCNHYNEA